MRIAFSVILLLFISCTATKNTMQSSFADNIVIAHRGAFKKNNLPENSIASLLEAIRLKCTGSEFDVRMSKDDTLLINHDPAYQKQDIEKTNYAELAKTPLSNGEKLPTLREYLLAGMKDNRQTRLVLEIKPSETKERGKLIAEKVFDMVKQLQAEFMVTYISFDYDILLRLKQLSPSAPVQYLNGEHSPLKLKADKIDGADYNLAVFRKFPEWITQAKENGIILNAWTVNKQEDMEWLIAHKFDFITTNEPELLLTLKKSK